ncbi:MAG TPA: response regulator [Candidatus Paceibacterota bacterium]|nr:response regulator [Candidatus Paceibacterota bacterium]
MADKWVLVVEDDVYIDKAYRAKFAHEQILAESVGDGEAALAILKNKSENLPSLVLLDMMLPKKNGFEVLSEMKANPKWKTIPVIILSNLGQESDAQKGLALGAVEYLVKADTKINTIVEKVRSYLR